MAILMNGLFFRQKQRAFLAASCQRAREQAKT